MSYAENPQGVQLEGADRDTARNHSSTAGNALSELANIVSRTLAREDASKLDRGFTVSAVLKRKAVGEPVDVTLSTFCTHDGECLGVYDAVEGVCRPCTESEAAHCLQSG
jgi:hypothetical protein